MKKNNAFRRAAALMAALSITVSLAAPAFAGTYCIDDGNITITKMDDGSQKIEQNGAQVGMDAAGDETIITTFDQIGTTLESDLEGPAAEDSGFGPVVEDNYQPAQPESTEEPEGADQQAAPAAAPAAPTSVNGKGNGVFGNTITLKTIADKVLNLTLKDVKIDVSDTGDWGHKGKAALSVQGKGDVEIELDGDNELKSGTQRAGLEKTSTGKLTLKDDNKEAGNLKATGGKWGAGIGSGEGSGAENITITGGTVTATGGRLGAGIGGGREGKGENITITGGTVTAAGGEGGAGIGGGSVSQWGGESGSGKNITINGGTVTAAGGDYASGIGGGDNGNGDRITITGGVVNAAGGVTAAGIGGGREGGGSKVTVSGAAQVTATATGSGPDWSGVGTGATIGNGGSKTPDGPVDGKEIQADISGLTTGYIHHIIYNPDLDLDGKPDGILKEWWEFALPKPIPDGESLDLHVETLKGAPLPFNTRQQGSTLRVTTDNLSARLHGTRQALETLQEQGVEQIQFVTTLKTTTLSVEDLLAEGGSWFALEHDGLGSRRLSAAQAESLKCWRH